MKKISLLFIVVLAMVYISCSTQKPVATLPPPQRKIEKVDPEGIRTMLILHPVENKFTSDGKNFQFLHDGLNQYLGVTDNDSIYPVVSQHLTEYITPETIGRNVILEISTSTPFSSFTTDARKNFTEQQGINFDQINQYQIGKAFNISAESRSLQAAQLLLAMLQGENLPIAVPAQNRIPVASSYSMLTIHPISNPVKDNNGKTWYFFLDLAKRVMYITDDENIYNKFSAALPIVREQDNAVLIQGMKINPFVFFEKDKLVQMAKDQGLELDGAGNASNDLNTLKIARISAYGIVMNYPTVITALVSKIGSVRQAQQPQRPVIKTEQRRAAPVQPNYVAPQRSTGSDRRSY